MKSLWIAAAFLACPSVGVGADTPAMNMSAGGKATFRVRQVVTSDGLSRGERLLNSQPPLQAGDVFTAELIEAPGRTTVILAGVVDSVTPPGRFGRPGKVSVKLAWPMSLDGTKPAGWAFNIEDQRFTSAQRRRAITTLFLAEAFALGASIGSQVTHNKAVTALGAGGVGLLFGVAYASLQTGQAASLEPGDVLTVAIGSTCAKKLAPDAPLTLFPAREAEEEKHKRKSP